MFETAIAMSVALSLLAVVVFDFADAFTARRRTQAAIRFSSKPAANVAGLKAANQAEVPSLPKAA